MQSSSLIFVVVVAIWAAYLVQYWVRRRDHLATIRSVDRFSAAMRVLDSHRLSQTAEPARSYAVSPTRAASPQVVVKRGVAAPEVTVPEPVAHPCRRLIRRKYHPAGIFWAREVCICFSMIAKRAQFWSMGMTCAR